MDLKKVSIYFLSLMILSSCASRVNKYSNDDEIENIRQSEVSKYKKPNDKAALGISKELNNFYKKEYENASNLYLDGHLKESIVKMELITIESPYYGLAQDKINEMKSTIKNKKDLDQYNQAYEYAKKKNYTLAIDKMKQVSIESEYYQNSRNKIAEWEKMIRNSKYEKVYKEAFKDAQNKNYELAKKKMYLIPNNNDFYKKAQIKIAEWDLIIIDKKYKKQFENAYSLANNNQYGSAISLMKKISPKSPYYTKAISKINEWQLLMWENKVKKVYDDAVTLSDKKSYNKAIGLLKAIPYQSGYYKYAQAKISEIETTINENIKKEKQEKERLANQKKQEQERLSSQSNDNGSGGIKVTDMEKAYNTDNDDIINGYDWDKMSNSRKGSLVMMYVVAIIQDRFGQTPSTEQLEEELPDAISRVDSYYISGDKSLEVGEVLIKVYN